MLIQDSLKTELYYKWNILYSQKYSLQIKYLKSDLKNFLKQFIRIKLILNIDIQ